MKGCNPLTDSEIKRITNALTCPRDRCLFILGIYTGFRISELLSIKVNDIYGKGGVRKELRVARMYIKGKRESRSTPVHPDAKPFILEHVKCLTQLHFLFPSKKGGALDRTSVHKILKTAFNKARVRFSGTHSMRKTFADRIHNALGQDVFKTQQALGHSRITSTTAYLSFKDSEISSGILSIKLK